MSTVDIVLFTMGIDLPWIRCSYMSAIIIVCLCSFDFQSDQPPAVAYNLWRSYVSAVAMVLFTLGMVLVTLDTVFLYERRYNRLLVLIRFLVRPDCVSSLQTLAFLYERRCYGVVYLGYGIGLP